MELIDRLAQHALTHHVHEATPVLEGGATGEAAALVKELPTYTIKEILNHLEAGTAALILNDLPEAMRTEFLTGIPPAQAAFFLRRLPSQVREQALNNLPLLTKGKIASLLRPHQATASALVDSEVLTLKAHALVKDVLKNHRKQLIAVTHDVAVVDDDNKLVGVLSPRALLDADDNVSVEAITRRSFPKLGADAPLTLIASHEGWHDSSTLMVVDRQGVFVGVLHYGALQWAQKQLASDKPNDDPSASRALGELFTTALGGMLEAIMLATSPRSDHD